MIDLHSHILPGIDDGARSLEVSLEMARIAVADGTRVMACTPHIYPGLYMNDAAGIQAELETWAPMVLGWPQQGAAWGWLLGLGVLHTGLAYVLLFAGMARLGLGRIAVLQFVYPLTAVLMDWVVYGRVLSPVQLAGVALMAAALWTLRRPAVRAAGG